MKGAAPIVCAFALLALCHARHLSTTTRHPIVFWPGYSLGKLQVTVNGQTHESNCPSTGTFEVFFPGYVASLPSPWTDECATKMLKLHVKFNPDGVPRYSNYPGVQTEVADFGSTDCAPFYEPVWQHLTAQGYVVGKDLAVACYDHRFTPSTSIVGQTNNAQKSKELVETIYKKAGKKPVYLLGHSNGPLYAKALLDSQTASWKKKYIAGFMPFGGNWPGQGLLSTVLFSGLSVNDFTFQPSTAAVYETFPSTYMSSARDTLFGTQITIVQDPTKSYTPGGPNGYAQLYTDAGLTLAAKLHPLYHAEVSTAAPGVNVHSVYGAGLTTVVGSVYTVPVASAIGTAAADFATRDGDGNQEDITNEANLVWATQDPCHVFDEVKVQADPVTYTNFVDDPAFHFNLPLQVISNAALASVLTTPSPAATC